MSTGLPYRNAARTLCLLSLCLRAAPCQPACKGDEQTRLRMVTERFSVGSETISITLPRDLFQSDLPLAYMEVSGANPGSRSDRLFLETSGVQTAVEDGAVLHLRPRVGERLLFALTTPEGQRLCSLEAHLRVGRRFPLQLPDGFRPAPSRGAATRAPFVFDRKTGEPIRLEVGGRLASQEAAEFQVDGLPARVLARTCWEVILRDPKPMSGLRTVSSQGYSITFPMVSVELQLAQAASAGRNLLRVHVRGVDVIRERRWPLEVMLFNFSGEVLTLLSGRLSGDNSDFEHARAIALVSAGKGEYTATCRVKLRRTGPVSLDAVVIERPPAKLPVRVPSVFPRYLSDRLQ
jgi:hypothetical protein